MKRLTQTEFFGKDLKTNWQITPTELVEIQDKIDDIYDDSYIISSEIIEAVCIALNHLGYIEI